MAPRSVINKDTEAQENKFLIFRAVMGSTQFDISFTKRSAFITYTHADGANGKIKQGRKYIAWRQVTL